MSEKGKKKVVKITNDGFPLESLPARGTITLWFDDGSQKKLSAKTRKQYQELLTKYGLN